MFLKRFELFCKKLEGKTRFVKLKNLQIVRQLQREMNYEKPNSLCETPSLSQSDFIIGQLLSISDQLWLTDNVSAITIMYKPTCVCVNIYFDAAADEILNKFKNQQGHLFRPRSIHLCQQRSNPSHETIYFKVMKRGYFSANFRKNSKRSKWPLRGRWGGGGLIH